METNGERVEDYEFSITDKEFGKNVKLNPAISNKAELDRINGELSKLKLGFNGLEFISFRDIQVVSDENETVEEKLDNLNAYSQTKTQTDYDRAVRTQTSALSREVKDYFFQACKEDSLVSAILRFKQVYPKLDEEIHNNCHIPEQLLLGILPRGEYLRYLKGEKPFFYITQEGIISTNSFYHLVSEGEISQIRTEIQKRKHIPTFLEEQLVNAWIEDISNFSFNDRFRFNEKNPCPYENFIGSLNKLNNSYRQKIPLPTQIGLE